MRHLLWIMLYALMGAGVAQADPNQWRWEGWATDFSMASVELSEIISGGPPRDGIPSIDDPHFLPASVIADIAEREPVIMYPLTGPARAYPLRVLIWHEIVNDVVDGLPVAVTYCPLCNSAVVFDRQLDADVLEFGTTGKLRKSDLVMYDRQTQSWWQQFSGEAIVGSLTGRQLGLLPSRIVSFGEFRTQHPDGKVLVPSDPAFRDYGRNPYVSYDTAEAPFLYLGGLPPDIPAMAHVVIVKTPDRPIVVTMNRVRQAPFEQDGYIVTFEGEVASALDARQMAEGRSIAMVRVTKDGADVPHDVSFAFVAYAFHPEVPIQD